MNEVKEVEIINKCINELVYEKDKIKKAYNYYHGMRDAEQFKHLEDNYGVGTPTAVEFTPLIKKHIDVLVGEYLELDQDMQVTCKDEKTVSNIMRDKKLAIEEELFKYFKDKLENTIVNTILESKEEKTPDPFFTQELIKIKNNVNKSFISEYEIAAQNLLTYFKLARNIDLKNKARELFTDLLISGLLYYRTKVIADTNDIVLTALNPIDTFVERNQNEYYLNKSPRAVMRF